MPFHIVTHKKRFEEGELVLKDCRVAVADDGFVTAQIEFACLLSALDENFLLFAMEAVPPIPPPNIASIPLEGGNVFLTSCDTEIKAGIAYITANYVGCSADQKRQINKSIERRSIIATTFPFEGVSLTESFDYDAEVMSVSFCQLLNEGPVPNLEPKTRDSYNGKWNYEVALEGLQTSNSGNGRIFSVNVSSGQQTVSFESGVKEEVVQTESAEQVGPVTRKQLIASARFVTE